MWCPGVFVYSCPVGIGDVCQCGRLEEDAAAVDPDAAAELSTALQGRRTFLTQFIGDMTEQLRPDLSPARAVALFYALTQPTIYQELVAVDGWSPEEYEVWLAATLQQQLLSSC